MYTHSVYAHVKYPLCANHCWQYESLCECVSLCGDALYIVRHNQNGLPLNDKPLCRVSPLTMCPLYSASESDCTVPRGTNSPHRVDPRASHPIECMNHWGYIDRLFPFYVAPALGPSCLVKHLSLKSQFPERVYKSMILFSYRQNKAPNKGGCFLRRGGVSHGRNAL